MGSAEGPPLHRQARGALNPGTRRWAACESAFGHQQPPAWARATAAGVWCPPSRRTVAVGPDEGRDLAGPGWRAPWRHLAETPQRPSSCEYVALPDGLLLRMMRVCATTGSPQPPRDSVVFLLSRGGHPQNAFFRGVARATLVTRAGRSCPCQGAVLAQIGCASARVSDQELRVGSRGADEWAETSAQRRRPRRPRSAPARHSCLAPPGAGWRGPAKDKTSALPRSPTARQCDAAWRPTGALRGLRFASQTRHPNKSGQWTTDRAPLDRSAGTQFVVATVSFD